MNLSFKPSHRLFFNNLVEKLIIVKNVRSFKQAKYNQPGQGVDMVFAFCDYTFTHEWCFHSSMKFWNLSAGLMKEILFVGLQYDCLDWLRNWPHQETIDFMSLTETCFSQVNFLSPLWEIKNVGRENCILEPNGRLSRNVIKQISFWETKQNIEYKWKFINLSCGEWSS